MYISPIFIFYFIGKICRFRGSGVGGGVGGGGGWSEDGGDGGGAVDG